MSQATLEHVNITVRDPIKTANRLVELFGWHIRWQGDARDGGTTVHVGADDNYLALYTPDKPKQPGIDTYATLGGLNHVGVVVDDLDATEARILDAGYKTHSHGDYDPGRRFYFNDDNGIEFEVVSY